MKPLSTVIRTKSGRWLCVIDFLSCSGQIILIDGTSQTAQPAIWKSSEVADLLSSGEWSVELSRERWARPTGTQSPRANDHQARLWDAIGPLLFDARLCRSATRQLAIDIAHERTGMSRAFLRTMLRKAWQGGMTAAALRTNVYECRQSNVDGQGNGRGGSKVNALRPTSGPTFAL